MEAAWFTMGYTTFPPSFPGVEQLSIFEATASDQRRGSSTLSKYFARPHGPDYDNLLYHHFFERYCMSTVLPGHARQANTYGEMVVGNRTYYCWRPVRRGVRLFRLASIYPSVGEVFFVRLMLLHKPARDMRNLKTVHGVQYHTTQEAAKAMGLIENDNETYNTLVDALAGGSPAALRRMFACMTMHGFPTAPIFYADPPNEILM